MVFIAAAGAEDKPLRISRWKVYAFPKNLDLCIPIRGTVGAQSIARAQSITHGHIGDVICQKTKI
jgi:hypothetical protein